MPAQTSIRPKSGPRDVFLHLLSILTLYFSAGSFMALIFQYINVYFPDPTAYSSLSGVYNTIRWSVASLIIVFPAYLLTTRYLNKLYLSSPEKLNLRSRKWLIYFTLFAGAVIIIGDLVTLVYNLLGGELTARFILKVLTVFFVAGSVFVYYYWHLKTSKSE